MSLRTCRLKSRGVFYSVVLIFVVVVLWREYVNYSVFTRRSLSSDSYHVNDFYGPPIDVFVFEEHHEAIPYWFNSSSGRLTEKKGLTLIHIDGHGDMGLPQSFRKFPYLRWPQNRKELDYYMQANDVFIMSAAMSGMFNKVVWVWPLWDQKNHDDEARDLVQMDVGWLMVDTSIPKLKRRTFCFCYKSLNPRHPKSYRVRKKEECRRLPTSLEGGDENYSEGVVIDRKACNTEISFYHEEIREDVAADIFRQDTEYYKENGVILDIDEDFYGCTFASRPLLNASFTDNDLNNLNEIISKIFCPSNAKEEQEADSVMSMLLDDVISSGCFSKTTTSEDGCQTKEANTYDKYTNILQTNKKHLNCGKTPFKEVNKEEQLRKLLHTAMAWNKRQLLAAKQVGFCSTTSKARGLDMTKGSEFHFCMGANTPNRTMVIEHKTTLSEINSRTTLLKNIFQALKPSLLPTMVTLCRSSRDGYVPREFQNKIESDIMDSLKAMSPLQIHYDEELLGGRSGWLHSRGIS